MKLRHVNIEPTNRCQLHCSFCGDKKVRPVGEMSIQDYEKILDMIPSTEIRLFLSGEPLLHPRIALFAEAALSRGHFVLIHSNGLALTGDLAEELVLTADDYPHMFTISFSLDSRIPIVERKRVRETIETLAGLNKCLKEPLEIIIQNIVPYPNELKPESWNANIDGVKYFTRYPHNWIGDKVEGAEKQTWEVPCGFIQDSLAIYWNGDVTTCCTDLNGTNVIGNIFKEGIEEIIRRLDEIAEKQIQGTADICKGCERYDQARNRPTCR